jgi:acetate kinase
MAPTPDCVLAMNAGSSSIKFAAYELGSPVRRTLHGKLDRIGLDDTTLSWQTTERESGEDQWHAADYRQATAQLLAWLDGRPEFGAVTAVGHRVVHGMARTDPARITAELLAELRRATPYAPEHLPQEIQLIEALGERQPDLPQVACFDTAFHAEMPQVARRFAIPRRYEAKGVQRYGFHGLSYAYLLEELGRAAGPDAARARVVLAHLGNGASLAAVQGGRSIDTSMGFTPAAGLVMSTRSGDLDPGLVAYLAQTEQMTAQQFDRMVHHESGLLGVSETSADMRDLLAREAADARAADAVALFCYQAKKWVGAFAAALGGLDTLVFSAGIGERAGAIRARICDGLGFLGVELDAARNAADAAVISTDTSQAAVRVIRTDEELMIARFTSQVLGLGAHVSGT